MLSRLGLLVHGWENMKNLNLYSSLGLSTLKNVTWYPTMTKFKVEHGMLHPMWAVDSV